MAKIIDYISVQRVERLMEIHIGCQQPCAEVTQTLSEDTECQDAIYDRLRGCELGWTDRGAGGLAALGGPCREESTLRDGKWYPPVGVAILGVLFLFRSE